MPFDECELDEKLVMQNNGTEEGPMHSYVEYEDIDVIKFDGKPLVMMQVGCRQFGCSQCSRKFD